MKFGFFSDIHGNSIGLKTCLEYLCEVEGVDEYCFLGDAVGYFPDAEGVVQLLKKYKVNCLMGNHDAMLLGQLPIDSEKDKVYQLNETRKHCSQDTLDFIGTFEREKKIVLCGKKVLLTHAHPLKPLTGYLYEHDEVNELLELETDVFIMGHTHRPFLKHTGTKTIINTGSCGLPRDIGNMISMLVVDTKQNTCEIKRVEMDIEKVIKTYPGVHPSVIDCLKRK